MSFIKKIIPSNTYRKLQRIKASVKRYQANSPVAQIYICNNRIKSRIGISNFYSVIHPTRKINARAVLNFYAKDGKHLLEYLEDLPSKGTLFLDVDTIFLKNAIESDMGIVTLDLIPKNKWKYDLSHLGLITSHFFMFYFDKDYSSTAHIHPLSILSPHNKSETEFESSQRISFSDLDFVELYQMNPTETDQECRFEFISEENNTICKKVYIPKYGVQIVHFNPSEFSKQKIPFTFKVSPLPSDNSKPLLLRSFKNKLFSMSHS